MLKALFAGFCVIVLVIISPWILGGNLIGVVLPVAALLAGAWYVYKRQKSKGWYSMYDRHRGEREERKEGQTRIEKQIISRFTERIVQKDVDVAGLISELRVLGQGAGSTETEFRSFLSAACRSAASAGKNFRYMPHILDNLELARRELSLRHDPSVREKFRMLFEISNGSVPQFSGPEAGIAREVLPEDKVVWVEPARYSVAGTVFVAARVSRDESFYLMDSGNILVTNHHICFSASTEDRIIQEPKNDSFRLRPATRMTPYGPMTSSEFILERVPGDSPGTGSPSAFPSVTTASVDSRGRSYFRIHLDDLKGLTWSEDALQVKHKGHWAAKFKVRDRNPKVKSVKFATGDGHFLYTLVTLLKGKRLN